MESREFLEALFADKPAGNILIWTLQDKRSVFCSDIDQAVDAADNDEKDTYVGAGLSPEDFGSNRRCPADQISAITSFWVDVDYAGEGHEKPNLPPDLESAQELVGEFPLTPSILVHSGGGLQCWWLLREPWVFNSDKERQEGGKMTHRFNATFRHLAEQHGWDLDATHDLARVMRVPGTYNLKTGEPRPVTMRFCQSDRRYSVEDIEQYLLDPEIVSEEYATYSGEDRKRIDGLDVTLDPNASPPFDKFQLLLESDDQFRKSWDRKRRDLQDQSPSAYDMSLANIAAMAGWESQEIADLMIAQRRTHGDDLKLRPDYYKRTIAKAIKNRDRIEAREQLFEMSDDEDLDTSDPETRKELLNSLSKTLGIKINRIIKFMSDPPQYRLETEQGSIMLNNVNELISQHKLRQNLAAAAGHMIPPFKKKYWHPIAQHLLDACEEVSMTEETTDRGVISIWLEEYLDSRTPLKYEHRDEAMPLKHPFYDHEGNTCIFLSNFRQWLRTHNQERVGARKLGALLRLVDAEPGQVAYKSQDDWTTRGVWKLPDDR